MIQKLKSLVLSVLAVGMIAAPVLAPVAVYAADGDTGEISNGLCQGANLQASTGTEPCDVAGTTSVGVERVNRIIRVVIDLFSLVVGVIAVIMIIIGGLKYITSGGDSGNITGAKNTILYAIIGLVVVALAQFIVKFVLNKTLISGQ